MGQIVGIDNNNNNMHIDTCILMSEQVQLLNYTLLCYSNSIGISIFHYMKKPFSWKD